uniref:Uncharacterized protein n=1 Tax=Coccolithus braarudii TaxID=221442 RepID=A0A7S0LCN2_9EUKA|mmetsp:Transcript_27879/g.60015  ORF Transcript_27879/g.60015 Transcript_27879/m.60015 type:complete len:208 (+) Transcript_27879:75-698(+)
MRFVFILILGVHACGAYALLMLQQAPRLSLAPRSAPVCMAGFGTPLPQKKGAGKASKKGGGKKIAALSAKKQWEKHTALLKGGNTANVHARDGSVDDDAWELVGSVGFESSGSAEAAASFQKRLILEHAKRMFPRLAVKQSALECGVEDDDGKITKLSKVETQPDLNCGFVGEADAGGFYSKGNRVEKNMAAGGAAPMADSKGRIGG